MGKWDQGFQGPGRPPGHGALRAGTYWDLSLLSPELQGPESTAWPPGGQHPPLPAPSWAPQPHGPLPTSDPQGCGPPMAPAPLGRTLRPAPRLPVLHPLKCPEGSHRSPNPRASPALTQVRSVGRYGSAPACWVRRDDCSWSHRACRWRSAGVQTDRGTGQPGLRRDGVSNNKGGAIWSVFVVCQAPFPEASTVISR